MAVIDVFWEQFLTENPGSSDMKSSHKEEIQMKHKGKECRKTYGGEGKMSITLQESHFRRENLMLVIFSVIIVLGSIFVLIVVPPMVAYDNHCVASTIILFASLVRSDVVFLLVTFFIYYKNA